MERLLLSRPWLIDIPGMAQFVADTANLRRTFKKATNCQDSLPRSPVSHEPQTGPLTAIIGPASPSAMQPALSAASSGPVSCPAASQPDLPVASVGPASNHSTSQPASTAASSGSTSCSSVSLPAPASDHGTPTPLSPGKARGIWRQLKAQSTDLLSQLDCGEALDTT